CRGAPARGAATQAAWPGATIDIDALYIRAGRAVTWFSAVPLVHIAGAIERGVGVVVARLKHVTANPTVAIQIAGKTAVLPLMQAFLDPSRSQVYEEDLSYLKEQYPDIRTDIWGGGYGVIFISIIAFLYFILDIMR
ncbi:MAG: hypothetical protein GX882_05245, partial [Methanomicrobiales archaeon]|nr:hypothetical protein [Methanomicrobiales archaeon]